MTILTTTFKFKEIFPNFQKFGEYLLEYEINKQNTAEDILFAKYLYKIIYRKYGNSTVQFTTPDDFKFEFANRIEDNFYKYKKQIEIIQKLHNISDQDMLQVTQTLTNNANNPNSTVEDPRQPLEFISAQAYSFVNNNKVQAYIQALSLMPTQLIDEILIQCRDLFKKIITEKLYIYEEE